ncbi:MAG TPA: glycoside hydrolase family 16 protein [Polyangiaceae bacterium]|nr:glycoside hydrolase family 16 protein [Polyangiaceae bacterium]
MDARESLIAGPATGGTTLTGGSASGGAGGSFAAGGAGTFGGGNAGTLGGGSGGVPNVGSGGAFGGNGGQLGFGGNSGAGPHAGAGPTTGGSATGGSATGGVPSGGGGAPAGWVLSWSDEFNGSGLVSSADWGYEVGKVRNNEAQYYTNADTDNAHMENGNLVITAIKEPMNNMAYTSASINTQGKRQFLYGRLEMRAKIPVAKGTWPAFWLLGINQKQVGWPKCGEIDVMENVGYEPNIIHSTSHTGADETGQHNGTINVDGLADNFFVYALEWSSTQLDFFIDDKKIFTYANDGAGNVDTWPYSQPFFLLINLAIGGSWGGQQGIDDAAFPHHYYIDYVRYYTRP